MSRNLIPESKAYNPSNRNKIADIMAKIGSDRTAELNALVMTIEHGGFSSAARHLGVTASAISKTVTRLESRLGVRLLNRTTRRLTPTPEGEAFFARGRRILAELDEAEQDVARFRGKPRGLLRMHSLVAFGLHQLPPVLPEFLRRYPEIELDLTVSDQLIDLVEEGADMVVRSGVQPDSSLVARKICDVERMICAAPSYLRQHGMPRTPDDLLQHTCLNIGGYPLLRRWPFDDPAAPGGVRIIEPRGNAVANNAESVLQMALTGIGIVRLVDMLVGEHVRAGRLVPILAEVHHVEPVPLVAMYPHARLRSPKVAAMVDFLLEHFAHAPWRQPASTAAREPSARKGGPRSRRSRSR
jgi:DNA-binding transcriptional LysR family regulator